MASLNPELRTELRKAVLKARKVAEEGARQALEGLSVPPKDPAPSLKPAERSLRNALRAHARHLGDPLDRSGLQAIDHLVVECAYEHWHRMLFARFLAENGLLLHPEGAAVSLDEVSELARKETPPVDPWTLASRWAARMLPAIFRPDDPVLAFDLAPENRIALERLLADLPLQVFTADDSLGWVYQFWQEEKKDEVNRSEVKIGADELPAVTQLFTEPYMVKFLLHNTLGAWWVGRHGGKPPIEMEFLRYLDDGKPAAGVFPEWPNRAAELKCLDPCCGSGHFLVEMLRILVAFRVEEEKLNTGNAVDAVLHDNLFGLEIDPRCTQIAAFAVALEAWKLAGDYRDIPADGLHIACSGIAPRAKKAEWLRLAGDDERLRAGLERLYDLFQDAPTLGSLIDPGRGSAGPFAEAGWDELRPVLAEALAKEKSADEEQRELGVAAQGIAAAAELLAAKYTLLATNVPYLGRGNQSSSLVSFADKHMPHASADLATLMLSRCADILSHGGGVAVVLPQNWWVGKAYSAFRRWILKTTAWRFAIVLGEEAWITFGNRGPNTILLGFEKRVLVQGERFLAIDVSTRPGGPVITSERKAEALVASQGGARNGLGSQMTRDQAAFALRPEARISLADRDDEPTLAMVVVSGEGSSTGDTDRFTRKHWEILPTQDWLRYSGPGFAGNLFCDTSQVLFWESGRGALAKNPQARIQSTSLWEQPGVLVGRVRGITATLSVPGCFTKGAVLICPRDPGLLAPLFSFLRSKGYEELVRAADPRVSAATGVLTDVPFDSAKWKVIAAEELPAGLPAPYSEDPTQDIFKGTVVHSTEPLQVAVARLLGYRWPGQEHDDLAGHADKEGIVCLSAVDRELPAAERLRALLAAAYGTGWSSAVEARLLASVGFTGRSLDEWLRDGFFEQHCMLFEHRPFVWHIWDGRKKDGFSALINYHKLDRKLLERLIFTVLGDWIAQLKEVEKQGEATAEARLAAALELKENLEAILEGEEPCDIFVRWKNLAEQPLGWEPDLNDGVRMNIRPFVEADVLRKKPNIKWDKDRGKNPPGSPWGEERLNDLHFTLAEKRKAREKAGKR